MPTIRLQDTPNPNFHSHDSLHGGELPKKSSGGSQATKGQLVKDLALKVVSSTVAKNNLQNDIHNNNNNIQNKVSKHAHIHVIE